MKSKRSLPLRLRALISSPGFFKFIVGLLIVQAVWIALTGRYPMAFDEEFHLGVIQVYANHLSPFWNVHPAGGDAFGAIGRDPSFLYHYLMSFPYRLVGLFTNNFMAHVLVLRSIDIGLFAAGLTLYRRLLLKTGASRAITHLSLLILILVPIVPLLAAQINYDNLALPLIALTLLMAIRVSKSLSAGKLDVKALLQLVALGIFASLVKYALLPILLVVVVYLIFNLRRGYKPFAGFSKDFRVGWSAMTGRTRVILLVVLTALSVLFVNRYGVNLVRYHAPVPDCAQVLNYDHCQHYGPWIRDYNFKISKGDFDRDPFSYSQRWLYGMWFRSFFAVDGPGTLYQTRGPLTVPALGAIALVGLGLGAISLTARKLWHRYDGSVLWLFVWAGVAYIALLWLEEYRLFLETGQAVAINGRYLLPVLPFLIVLSLLAVREITAGYKRVQLLMVAVVLICFLWGGGALTYILRSNDDWYWPNSFMRMPNHGVQRLLGPVTPGHDRPIQYLH